MPKYLNVSATQRVDYIIEATFNHTWRLAKFITRIPHKLASTHKIHTHSHTHLCKHTHMRSTYICLAIGQDNCWRFAGRIYFLASFLYPDIRCSHSSPCHSTHPTLLLGNCTRAQSVTYAHECEHDICWFRTHTHTYARTHLHMETFTLSVSPCLMIATTWRMCLEYPLRWGMFAKWSFCRSTYSTIYLCSTAVQSLAIPSIVCNSRIPISSSNLNHKIEYHILLLLAWSFGRLPLN